MNGVEKLKKQLLLWGKQESKLVVGLDGYSGMGKTTAADLLKELLPKIEIIHMDEYVCTAKRHPRTGVRGSSGKETTAKTLLSLLTAKPEA